MYPLLQRRTPTACPSTVYEKLIYMLSPVHTVAEKYDCRRKERPSQKMARQRRHSPNTATVALFCDKLSHFSVTVWTGFYKCAVAERGGERGGPPQAVIRRGRQNGADNSLQSPMPHASKSNRILGLNYKKTSYDNLRI